MVSSSIIYTLIFTMGALTPDRLLFLIDSIHASSIHKNVNHDDTILSLEKRSVDHDNDLQDEYEGLMLNKHRFASRGVRLPSESILLGKRRLPVEAVLLGRRNSLNEDLLSKRR